MSNSIKINYIYNLLLNISRVLFPLVTAPYVSRVLSPEGIGLYNFTSTYSSYFGLFAGLGISTYGVREIAKRRRDVDSCSDFISKMFSLEIITTILASIIYIATIIIFDKLHEHALLFFISGIVLYFTPFKVEWYFSGKEDFEYITKRSLIIKTIGVVLLFIVVRDKEDLANYLLLYVSCSLANEFWNFYKLKKEGIRIKFVIKGLREHIKPILILFASSVSISIYSMLDTLMLGFFSDYTEVGYYNTAMHLIRVLFPIVTSLSIVCMPRISNYIGNNNTKEIQELLNKSAALVAFMAFPITIGIIMVSREFTPLFFGQEFYEAVMPMKIGSLIIIAIGFNNLNGIQMLIAYGKDKLFLYSVTCGACLNCLLNLILIPNHGANGAAIASVIAEFSIFVINEFFMRKKLSIKVSEYSDIMKSAIGAVLFIPICLFLNKYLIDWYYVVSAVIICSSIYLLFEYIIGNSTCRNGAIWLVNNLKFKNNESR